ncbi:MAG: sugar ABC transporter permease [Chloroflexi bacterium]|nr:sugar ABC transporter permease [Chloroflexota bacterium]
MSQIAPSSTLQPATTRPAVNRWRILLSAVEGYLYLAPTLIILGIFVYAPVFTSFNLSLKRVAPFGGREIWVGAGNYTRLLNNPDYWNSVKVTLLFTLGTVPTGLILAVLLAIALSYPLKHLSGLHRLLIFVPVIISSAVAGVLFRWLYHPVVGYINYLLTFIGIEQGPNWLASKQWALWAVIIATIWKEFGFNVIVALAGVQNIDESFYDAAKVDGANTWHRIRHVTLPLLTPTLFFLLIINVIHSFEAFGQIHVLTEGGPGQATMTMVYRIFYDAFVGTPQRGIASAQAYLLALMVIAMSFVQFSGLGKRVHYQ